MYVYGASTGNVVKQLMNLVILTFTSQSKTSKSYAFNNQNPHTKNGVGVFSIYTEKKHKAASKTDTQQAVSSNCAFLFVQSVYQSADSLIR